MQDRQKILFVCSQNRWRSHISDDYAYMDGELVELLKANLSEYIEVPE
jgi:predicted protein tyrosine phosphatase